MRTLYFPVGFAALIFAGTSCVSAQTATSVVQNSTNIVIVNNGSASTNYQVEAAPNHDMPAISQNGSRRSHSLWSHNGSVIALESRGNLRQFYYQLPRVGLAQAGARSGSLLFEGARLGNTYEGKARIFAGSCGVYSYEVSGPVIDDRRVVVTGMAPRVRQQDCQVYGYLHDTLVFDLL